jgi:hypothetical protein
MADILVGCRCICAGNVDEGINTTGMVSDIFGNVVD